MEDIDRARNALATLRPWLEAAWLFSHQNYIWYGQNFFLEKRTAVPAPLSSDMCRHTSLALQSLLAGVGETGWKAVGGFMRHATVRSDKGAYKAIDGQWRFDADGRFWGQHWWLEKDGLRLDLTADQFGWETVNLSVAEDERYERVDELCRQRWLSSLKRTVSRWMAPALERPSWGCDAREHGVRIAFAPAQAEFARLWVGGPDLVAGSADAPSGGPRP